MSLVDTKDAILKENGDFELRLIERNSYNQNNYDNLLANPCSYAVSRLTHVWRETEVREPKWMPDRYYQDIRTMYDRNYKLKVASRRSAYEKVQDFMENLELGRKIEKYHSF